ncbi:TonB-dependent receptor [Elongatibacter sediminis]|uniref:TonB-dependent receptor n=1 Tax=Elongatibacter sediminis TaxID=3119006 RepID=A0AAW9R6T7_9GAMM
MARKRAENIQEVPIAVSAFTAEDIRDGGIERPSDFVALIPNVTLVDTANVGDTQLSIRGIVSTRDAESTFAYVVDGVLITNPNAFNGELIDVAQIEVLKGPQGALYGRNAVAGAIIVNTKQPGEEFEGIAQAGVGNNDTYKASAYLSGPLTNNVSASLTAHYSTTDGHYDNVFTGEDDAVDYLEEFGGRARVIWEVSDRTTLDFRAGTRQVDGGAINFNAVFGIPGFVAFLGSPTYFADVNEHEMRYAFNVPGENEQETREFSVKADWDLDRISVTAIAAYNDLDENLLSVGSSASFYPYELTPECQSDRVVLNSFTRPDLFGDPLAPFLVLPPPSAGGEDFAGIYGPYGPTRCDGYQYQERNQEDLSLELRVTSSEDQSIRWIAGAYYLDIEREVVSAYGADQGAPYAHTPYIPPSEPNPTDSLFWDIYDTQVLAAYGQVEFDLGETMEMAFALRYDEEDRSVSNAVPNVLSSGLNLNLAGQPINPAFMQFPQGIPDRSRTFSEWQPKITWRWSPLDSVNVYASWGRGFRSGGFNSIGSESLINFWYNQGFGGPGELVGAGLTISDEYQKEVTDSFEIGIKSMLFDNRLRLNAAIFQNDVDDNQFFEFFAGPYGLLRVVTTIDEAQVRGFEADFDWQISDGFRVYGGLGLLDSEIKENINRPLSVGNDLPQAPEQSFNLGSQINFPISERWEFMARVDWQYIGEMWFHTMQGEATPTIWQVFFGPGITQDLSRAQRDSVSTINARVELSNENWRFTLWSRNLGDEEYLQEVIPSPEFGGSFIHPSALRSYGLDVTYSF